VQEFNFTTTEFKIMTRKFIGFDPSGIRRVFAATYEEAMEEAESYVLRRPDTGPLHQWIVKREKELRL
jgi:hypothetical protein